MRATATDVARKGTEARWPMRQTGWVVLAITLLTAAAAAAAAQDVADQAEPEIPTAPVTLDGVTILRVRGTSSYPAVQRAQLITERLHAAAADASISPDSLRLVDIDNATRIYAGNSLLMGVVEADASLEQLDRLALAESHRAGMRQAIIDFRAARSPAVLWMAAIRCVIATAVLIALFAALHLVWRWIDRLLAARLKSRLETVEARSFQVVRAEQMWAAVRSAMMAVRLTLYLVVAFVYVGYVLAQLPWFRGVSRDLAQIALAPLEVIGRGLVANIPGLLFLVVLAAAVRLGLRFIRLFFEAVGRGAVELSNFDPEWAQPTYNLVRIAIIAFAIVVAYPYIPGSGTAAFQGVSLFIGIVFSIGSSSAIANIVAGYLLTYRRALKVGDRVKIGDAIGDVIDIRMQVTHLRSLKNEEIIIPNSQILNGEVVNYSSLARTDGLILHTEVGIGYETPWRQVEAMLLDAARRTEGVSTHPAPFILQQRLGDFAIVYELNAYTQNVPAMKRLYSELHRNILDVFNEYGVQIMTPAYEGDPERPKVVATKDWYAPPAITATRAPMDVEARSY